MRTVEDINEQLSTIMETSLNRTFTVTAEELRVIDAPAGSAKTSTDPSLRGCYTKFAAINKPATLPLVLNAHELFRLTNIGG